MVSMGFLSVVSPDSFLPFVSVFLSSVSEPCPYPSCLCLPSRTSFFHCSAAWFTITTRKEPMAPLTCACAVGSGAPILLYSFAHACFAAPGFDQKKTLVVPHAVVFLSHPLDHSVSDCQPHNAPYCFRSSASLT